MSEILGEALESAIDTAGSTTKSGATSDGNTYLWCFC